MAKKRRMKSNPTNGNAGERLSWLRERYDQFNALCFQHSLPQIPIRLTRANSFGGKLQYKRVRRLYGKEIHTDFVLVMDISHNRTDEAMEDILLHEMIHFYIEHHHIKDTSTHGRVFRQMMNDINERFGRHITVSLKEQTAEADTRIRTHWVCLVSFRDGRQGITVTGPTGFQAIHSALQVIDEIASTQWYISHEPFFNRYPHARSLKVYHADSDKLAEHLQSAKALHYDGHRWLIAPKP